MAELVRSTRAGLSSSDSDRDFLRMDYHIKNLPYARYYGISFLPNSEKDIHSIVCYMQCTSFIN